MPIFSQYQFSGTNYSRTSVEYIVNLLYHEYVAVFSRCVDQTITLTASKRVGDHPGSVTVYILALGPVQNLCDNTYNVSPAQYRKKKKKKMVFMINTISCYLQ